ncbi:magnesium transporter MgtE N-terminal domain-containing protein, partial [Clostridium butyricum]
MNCVMTKERLLEILLYGSDKELQEAINKIHPADILDIIHDEENDFVKILNRLPDWMIADIIEEEEDEEKYEILKNFSENKQKNILGEMFSDEITDMVGA